MWTVTFGTARRGLGGAVRNTNHRIAVGIIMVSCYAVLMCPWVKHYLRIAVNYSLIFKCVGTDNCICKVTVIKYFEHV